MTANGTTQTTEHATDNVCDWDMFGEIQLLKESPAVLSLEKLCEENRYLYELHPSQPNHISPWVVPGMQAADHRPELRVTGSRHELWATMTYKWKLTYKNGFSTSHRRINKEIATFDRCLCG